MPYAPRASVRDRERIISAFERGEDFIQVVAAMNINRSTAYSIVRTYQRTGRVETLPPSGGRPQVMDEESIELAVMLIEGNPTITLKSIRQDLIEVFPSKPIFSVSTLHR